MERIARQAMAPSTIDRCFVLAVQILTTVIPMLVAVTAFAPQYVREHIEETVKQIFGLEGGAGSDLGHLIAGPDDVRQEVGVVGLVFALMSATSLTRRFQRLYEECWEVPAGRMTSSAGRWIAWMLVWVASLALQGPLRSGHGLLLAGGWVVSAAMSLLLWWWTPHLLLLGRVGWRALLPTALMTGGMVTTLNVGSRIVMPRTNEHAIQEYGPYGIVLTLISWLLVQAGAIVIGALSGRTIAARNDA